MTRDGMEGCDVILLSSESTTECVGNPKRGEGGGASVVRATSVDSKHALYNVLSPFLIQLLIVSSPALLDV